MFNVCAAASVACLVLGNRRAHDIVLWWPAIMATTLLMVGLAAASVRRGRAHERPEVARRAEVSSAAPA
jgi:hypothetical protein